MVCAAVKGNIGFQAVWSGIGIEIREFWSRIGYQYYWETGKWRDKFSPE